MADLCWQNARHSLFNTLRNHIGQVVIIFTNSGGRAGDGFTGLLTRVNEETCQLVTSIPSRIVNPVTGCGGGRRGNDGTVCTIPLDSITCVSASEGW